MKRKISLLILLVLAATSAGLSGCYYGSRFDGDEVGRADQSPRDDPNVPQRSPNGRYIERDGNPQTQP